MLVCGDVCGVEGVFFSIKNGAMIVVYRSGRSYESFKWKCNEKVKF